MRTGTLFTALLFLASQLHAGVRPAKVFTSGMVLQQQMPLPVFGFAEPGEAVAVTIDGHAATTTTADKDGRWRVTLPSMTADGQPHTLTIKGNNTVVLDDVRIGEVWLAIGQSNMSRGLRYVKDRAKAEPMDFPNYRLFFVGLDQVPQRDEPAVTKGWAPATHESMNKVFVHEKLGPYEFSEVTYYFGKHLHERLNVPVGMISAAFPGSMANQWTPAENPSHFDFASGKPDKGPGSMYQAMLHGLPPFAIRGVIYYQGENDASNANYVADLTKLIESWRSKFQRPDMPFLMTQIAQTTFNGGPLRVTEAQLQVTRTVPHTALASSNDLIPLKPDAIDKASGYPIVGGGDPHPPNKHVVSARLAAIALAQAYGKKEGEPLPPVVVSQSVDGPRLRVTFANVGSGLKTSDGAAPNWFQLVGEDGKFVNATARIVSVDTIELSADGIAAPKQFRFAYHPLARHNLYNSSDVPAISFASDKTPLAQELVKPAPAAAAAPTTRKADPPQPTSRTPRSIEGWTVRVDDRLLKAPDDVVGQRALKFLEAKLAEIKLIVPAERVKDLQTVTIVLDLTCGKLGPMQYHPSAGWLKANGFSEDLARCVHLPRAADVATSRNVREQPMVILHELSHAYHDQFLSFDEPRVKAAYEAFKKSGHGDQALLYNGKRVRHYGLTDHKEFFAEMSEAYFGWNDFYPFNRAELMESEPELYKLLAEIWSGKPKENK